MKKNLESGFTLIEVIVVVATIALLAAILAPQITKHISDAKISKSRADVNTIASAIGDFYKDTGRFPTGNSAYDSAANPANGTSSTNPGIYVLSTNQGTTAPGHTARTNQWITWANDLFVRGDTFRNQMVVNAPGNTSGGTASYPIKQGAPPGLSFADIQGWNGPYLKTIPADPWGHKYYVNVISLYFGTGTYIYDQCWVLSAGPNGVIETPVGSSIGNPQDGELNAEPLDVGRGGDDIGVMIK